MGLKRIVVGGIVKWVADGISLKEEMQLKYEINERRRIEEEKKKKEELELFFKETLRGPKATAGLNKYYEELRTHDYKRIVKAIQAFEKDEPVKVYSIVNKCREMYDYFPNNKRIKSLLYEKDRSEIKHLEMTKEEVNAYGEKYSDAWPPWHRDGILAHLKEKHGNKYF